MAADAQKIESDGLSKDILEVLAEFIAESKRQEERALAEIASVVDGLSADQRTNAITAFQTFDRTHQEMVEISEILLRLSSQSRAIESAERELNKAAELLNDVRLEKLKASLKAALGIADNTQAASTEEDVTLF